MIKLTGLAMLIFAFASLSVSAQVEACQLSNISVTGEDPAVYFNITQNVGTLTIDPIGAAVWGTIQRSDSNGNVQTTISPNPPTLGTNTPVTVTAIEVAPAQSGDFALAVTVKVFDPGAGQEDTIRIWITATADCEPPVTGCTLTQGYWKNHPEDWPVESSLLLGNRSYTKEELLSIFNTPVKGNGLISLAHQLIAAKLNAEGASVPASVATAISQADALIGARVVPPVGGGSLTTAETSALVSALDAYNNGLAEGGPGHCGD